MRISMPISGGHRRRRAIRAICGSPHHDCSASPPAGPTTRRIPHLATTPRRPATTATSPQSRRPCVQAAASQALGDDTPVTDMDPTIQVAFQHAAVELTPEQLDKAFECWEATTCDIGDGETILGIADGFGQNTWRKFSKMEIILQALTYPEIGKIISTDAAGDLNKYLQNVRSLGAQGAKAIVAYDDFGDAALPAFQAGSGSKAPSCRLTWVACQVRHQSTGWPTRCTSTSARPGRDHGRYRGRRPGKIQGEVAILNGTPGNPQGATWNKCFEDKITRARRCRSAPSWTPTGPRLVPTTPLQRWSAPARTTRASSTTTLTRCRRSCRRTRKAGETTPDLVTIHVEQRPVQGLRRPTREPTRSSSSTTRVGLNWDGPRTSLTAVMQLLAGDEV